MVPKLIFKMSSRVLPTVLINTMELVLPANYFRMLKAGLGFAWPVEWPWKSEIFSLCTNVDRLKSCCDNS